MTVRKWRFEDILVISELEKECFHGEAWSYKTLVQAYENPNTIGLVAEEYGEIIGYGCATCVFENADLENILIVERYRRGGRGRRLLYDLLGECKARGAEKVFLEVRVSNSAALSLYLSAGFSGLHARTRYYPDGEDCLVMQKSLNQRP